MKSLLKSLFILFFLLFSIDVFAQLNQQKPDLIKDLAIDEKLGNKIPLDTEFVNSTGRTVTLAELLEEDKPVLLNPLYYECPTLCGVVLDAVFNVVNRMEWSPGNEYNIISFSIDPSEDYHLAAENKQSYLSILDRENAENGWYFLTGNEEAINKLTDAIGFSYKFDEQSGEYVHLAAIMMLSPNGAVTRYFYGINFQEFQLKNALYEASSGTVGSTLDKVVLYCFTYDPSSNSYVPVAINIMKLGGLATVLFLGIFLGIFWMREKNSVQSNNIVNN